jgi:hypothetical protein
MAWVSRLVLSVQLALPAARILVGGLSIAIAGHWGTSFAVRSPI